MRVPSSFLATLRCCALLAAAGVVCFSGSKAEALEIDFRPACNLGGTCQEGDFFFDHPEALDDLNFVAQAYSPFSDSLSVISGATVNFTHPDSGAAGFSLGNFSAPADTVVIYVGARDLPSNQVASAGPGGPSGTFDRGQGIIAGGGADEFALWGGAIAFDTKTVGGADRNWHFGHDAPPAPFTVDFLSVALHELGHVFGFGTADSFENQVTGGEFQGATAAALYGGNVPVAFNPVSQKHEHWAYGVTSPPYAVEPDPSYSAVLTLGDRTLVSPLDYSALDDVGWEVPEQLLGLHGNTDGDDDVDGLDFLAWQRGAGTASGATALIGDLNGEGGVDLYDLWLWEQNLGATSGVGPLSVQQSLPEPKTWSLIVIGALGCAGLRRRDAYRIPAIKDLLITCTTP